LTRKQKIRTVKDVLALRIFIETMRFSQQKLYSHLIINKTDLS